MRKIRRRILGSIIFFLFIGLFLFLREPEDVDKSIKIEIIEKSIRSPMNQGECHRPHLPIDNPEIMKFYKPVGKIDCGNRLDDWVMCEKSICFVKPEISASHGEVICSYTDLIRKSDYKIKYGKPVKTREPYVLQNSDFVKAVCSAESGHSWFGMAFGIRDTVQRSIPPNMQLYAPAFSDGGVAAAGASLTESLPYYNVVMFGFDSLSHNAFIRKLPKTYAYLTTQLNATVLKGYNIVGDGTPQALIPLLTGYSELELPETRKRMRNSLHVDVYPMIWKEYARYGYVTSFNEDLPEVGTFTYRMNGFKAQPVDHYLRSFYVEKENIWSNSKEHCIGHQPDHVVMLEYTKNFILKYSDSPRFVFSFHGSLSHDSINLIEAADDDVTEWLADLKERHTFDNTILIFMSDHGNRFSDVRATLQGKQEERLPFFSFAFPEAFKKRFPQQYANFRENAEKLTTPFDIHATLLDILKLQSTNSQTPPLSPEFVPYDDVVVMDASKEKPHDAGAMPKLFSSLAAERAISLFNVIPINRSCADAYIEPHWCACLRWRQLALNDTSNTGILLKMAASIVNTINNVTNDFRSLCAPLELQKINWAMRLLPHKEMLHFKGNSDRDGYLADMSDNMHLHEEVYQLQISVTPGASLFEATVTHNLRTFSALTKLSEISRVNKYGAQANCIYERNPELRKYCYCRT